MSLLQRMVLAAAQSGVRDFVLVGDAGIGWEDAMALIARDPTVKSRGLGLEFVPFPQLEAWGRERKITGPLWLMRAPLVFDPEALARAAGADRGQDENLNLVVRIPGRDKPTSAGISLCAAAFFPKLAATLAGGGAERLETGLINGPPGLAGSREFEIEGLFSRVISAPDAYASARKYLLGTARKPTDSFFSRHFNRYISLFLTQQFLRLGVPPNVLSVVCLLIGLSSGWFIGRGGYGSSALGALLFEFASIFDGCDGEVSRLTYRTSKVGGFLDMIGDASTYIVFFLSLPFGLYRSSRHTAWLVLGIVALLSMGMFYIVLSTHMRKAKLGNNVIGVVKDIERSAGRPGFTGRLDGLAAKIGFIYRRDFFATLVCLIILAGGSGVLMSLLAVFMPLEAVYLHFFSRRRLRQAA